MEDPVFSDREGVGGQSAEDAQKRVEDVRGMVVEEDGAGEPPDWLPDGWIMEVRRGDDGELREYYICPVSGVKFSMKAEVMNYLFAEMDEQHVETMKAATAPGMLHTTHEWLPKGWHLEIRAGGEKMDKMYKFYTYPPMRIRLFSKEDVLLYVKEKKVSKCDIDGQCDTSSQENVLAEVMLDPSGLQGWVLELVYRKAGRKGGMRKDKYYTDPVSRYTFRTLKSAVCYLETKELTKCAFIQKTSVHEVYNFENCADLHESLRKRQLTKDGKADITTASSLKSRRSSRGVKINYYEKTLAETIDTSTDSVSQNEDKEIKKKSIEPEMTRQEANSPPKLSSVQEGGHPK